MRSPFLRRLGVLALACLVMVGGAALMRVSIFNVVIFTDSLPVFTGCGVLYAGENPYTPQATAHIQAAILARAPRYDFTFDQHRFAYPAHVCVVIAPFALFDYDAVTPYWLFFNFLSFALLPVVFYRGVVGGRVPPFLLGVTVFVCLIGWRYSMIHIILGQFVFLVLWGMLGAVLALQRGRDRVAGVCLAVMTVRPEGFFLMLPLLLYALWGRRWRVLAGVVGAMGAVAGVTFALAGFWVGDFLGRLQEYGTYRQQATQWLPSLLGVAGVGVALVCAVAWAWVAWRVRHTSPHERWAWAISLLCVGQFLLVPQTNTYTLIYALVPFLWCAWLFYRQSGVRFVTFVGITLAGIWAWQSWGTGAPFMLDALLLPLWLLAVLSTECWLTTKSRRGSAWANQQENHTPSPPS